MPLSTTESRQTYRERCYDCYRPVGMCFCDVIPTIANRTHVLILQHVRERFHAFNTARIVRKALTNSDLIVDQTTSLAQQQLPLHEKTGVLYPAPGATLLTDLAPHERPEQLVILDGTWHHAKTFMRQIPVLQALPRFGLQPAAPSNYRIRKEPTESAVSTLEATVEALRILEPETLGLGQLLRAFDTMIDAQVQHPALGGRPRHHERLKKTATNIPAVLLDEPENVVVVYGEAAHGPDGIRSRHREPVYWVAQRLLTEETFARAIRPCPDDSPEFLQHLQLNKSDFAHAVTHAEFRNQWSQFVRPTDTIVAFNHSTLRLLTATGVPSPASLTLKAVHLCPDCRTLAGKLMALGIVPPPAAHQGRAGRRLANAVAYVRYLQDLSGSHLIHRSGPFGT